MALQTSEIVIILLVALMSHNVMARSSYIPMISQQALPLLLGEIDDSDESYQEARKISEVNPALRAKWPWLKEVLLGGDYDDSFGKNMIVDDESKPTLLPFGQGGMVRKTVRGHVQKKSNSAWGEYMAPCHLKMCNFGRKRNVLKL